ncbi:unnamed protein product [Rotaria sp. Silwood2]|nr:unnamed protein product [Rotaria sp. Silwood2]CAF2916697.1 unnamed protein product [Rotaria sp. Silwood2]CAF3183284.1 unnamed protein product [Rotaria sp. Silwood2]CAF3232122.1 unnamed protein product [Rotaria sp. Silwood2]CAF3900340.1 unnamed protein product [Rotaria sp. Silwood2]
MSLEAIGVTEETETDGPFTLFAPNDAAFKKVPQDIFDRLSDPKNREELALAIGYHAVAGKALTAAQIQAMSLPARLETITGEFVTVTRQNNQIKVNDATIIASDIVGSNGIIHVIDKVLMPPSKSD